MTQATLVWFRQDLRLEDQPALLAAVQRGEPVIPVYIASPLEDQDWSPGAASRWWLHRSLTQLDEQLKLLGSRLIVRQGDSFTELWSLIEETEAAGVVWTRRYEPSSIERDSRVKLELRSRNRFAESYNGQLLFEPWTIQTKEGRPYQVFTPFWKTCLSRPQPEPPERAPEQLVSPRRWPRSLKIRDLGLEPTIHWDAGLKEAWQPGAKSASEELHRFLNRTVFDYVITRDRPAEQGTSRLSPHLHFGEISPRTIWYETQLALNARGRDFDSSGAETYLKEIGWREFAHHLLYHFPKTTNEPLRNDFTKFPWRDDTMGFTAWKRGQTGYPIVDAGMRELWSTGWMHNRVRMIVASFLVKDLLIPWQQGAAWFWDTLVDADLASNTMGWQWSSGCGADAAPYFRVFNPTSQSEKFDPDGQYLRRWTPELKRLESRWIHAPWTAPEEVLRDAGIELGTTYPHPIVDHGPARLRALQAFAAIKLSS